MGCESREGADRALDAAGHFRGALRRVGVAHGDGRAHGQQGRRGAERGVRLHRARTASRLRGPARDPAASRRRATPAGRRLGHDSRAPSRGEGDDAGLTFRGDGLRAAGGCREFGPRQSGGGASSPGDWAAGWRGGRRRSFVPIERRGHGGRARRAHACRTGGDHLETVHGRRVGSGDERRGRAAHRFRRAARALVPRRAGRGRGTIPGFGCDRSGGRCGHGARPAW